jgi:dolichol-phosphate mannosyltransferase
MIKVNVIIPVFDEGKMIIKTLENVHQSLKKNYIISICYDFEEDKTLYAIEHLENRDIRLNIKFVKNPIRGPHSAIMKGIYSTNAKYYIIVPADDHINTLNLHRLVELADSGYDIVCPSRFIKGGKMIGAPIIKSIINRIVNLLLKYSGIPTADATNGFRLFNKKIINNIQIKSNLGFTYSMEFLIRAYSMDYKITEYPSLWVERNIGNSKFKLGNWCFQYLYFLIYGMKVGISKKVKKWITK